MKRQYLLAAVSAVTLATMSAPTTSALAFDKIDWDWYLDVKTDFTIREHIDPYIDPKGATIVEIEQNFKGDNWAYASVKDVYVDPKGRRLDAGTQLGAVTNVAAALGNSATVTTETMALVDVKQETGRWYNLSYLDAKAYVYDIDNASVSNAAQAIGNSFSLTLDPLCGRNCREVGVEDMLAIVNVEQQSYSNGYAYADVYDVTVKGFYDLGTGDHELNRAIVSNAAIAAGNVASITVVRGAIPFPDQNN